jgi:hypothetical protein
MFRLPLLPIANEMTIRINELQRLASIASQKFDPPVIFVFDTKSTWSIHAEAFSEATGYPKEAFLPHPHQRFSVGFCSWLLCEYAAKNLPLMAEEILEICEPGRARILSFFEVSDGEAITSGNILIEHSQLS